MAGWSVSAAAVDWPQRAERYERLSIKTTTSTVVAVVAVAEYFYGARQKNGSH